MKRGLVIGLVFFVTVAPSVFAEGLDVYHIDPPQEDMSRETKSPQPTFTLPQEKPEPIITISPTTANQITQKNPATPNISTIDPAEPVELKAAPAPVNPNIPCELQVPWENGTPAPCKKSVPSPQIPNVVHTENLKENSTQKQEIIKPSPTVAVSAKQQVIVSNSPVQKKLKNENNKESDVNTSWSFFKKVFTRLFQFPL